MMLDLKEYPYSRTRKVVILVGVMDFHVCNHSALSMPRCSAFGVFLFWGHAYSTSKTRPQAGISSQKCFKITLLAEVFSSCIGCNL
jgi:hypothetical protein